METQQTPPPDGLAPASGSPMRGLCYRLSSNGFVNDPTNLDLDVWRTEHGDIALCLTGNYRGENIQIDFNDLSPDEALELSDYIRQRVTRVNAQAEQP